MTAMSMDRQDQRRMKGFEQTGHLLQSDIRKAGEGRGFAVSRLLTHWSEVAGENLAKSTRPVRINYGKGGIGATLTLLVRGAEAPFVQAELPKLKDRVNAVYGYAAVSRITLTQTAPTGFAEGQIDFDHRPKAKSKDGPSQKDRDMGAAAAKDIRDPELRLALSKMGAHILTSED